MPPSNTLVSEDGQAIQLGGRNMRQAIIATSIVAIGLLGSVESFAYSPEPQTVRTITTSCTPPTINTFSIYAQQNTDYWSGAETCHKWLFQEGIWLNTYDISTLGTHGLNQIILGNPSTQPAIAQIASEHHMTATDLGNEGYLLHSEPAPGPCGTWRIIIIANTPAGITHGLATLMQAVQYPDPVPSMVIRDYPDRPTRTYQYRPLPGPLSGQTWSQWLINTQNDIDVIARLGVDSIHFNSSRWATLGESAPDVGFPSRKIGDWFKLMFDYSRSLGVEPIPEVSNIVPTNLPGFNPLLVEGKFVAGEPYIAHANQDLINLDGPFDNSGTGENLTWEDQSNGFPVQWSRSNQSLWQFVSGQNYMSISNAPASGISEDYLQTQIQVRPGSYYVLKARLSNVSAQGAYPSLSLRTSEQGNEFKYLPIISQQTEKTYELPFSTPPDVSTIYLRITTNAATQVYMNLLEVHLDRRDGSFVNLMLDPPGTGGPTPLKVIITSYYGQPVHNGSPVYVEGVDYEAPRKLDTTPYDWRMPSTGPNFAIKWLNGDPAYPVRVYCTLGVPNVPADQPFHANPFCFSDPDYYSLYYDHVFHDIFTTFHLDPMHIGIDIDEVRGINRCGRCVRYTNPQGFLVNNGSGLPNNSYFINFVNTIRARLTAEGGAALQTKLMAFGDMLSPTHNGADSLYQYSKWLGQAGAGSGALAQLTTELTLYLWSPPESHNARTIGWPGSESGQVKAIASLFEGENPIPWVTDNVGGGAPGETWYQNDALGFFAYQYATRTPNAGESDLLNYAWKRYANPDASVQVFGPFGDFRGQDGANHVVSIAQNQALTFYPFGRAEARNGCSGTLTASINWGDGTSATVTSILNVGSVNHAYSQAGLKTATLTVSVDQACNGVTPPPKSVTVQIQVNTPPGGGCTKNCPEESPLIDLKQPLVTAIRVVAPNPFAQSAVVHFSTEESSTPEIKIYDVAGRLVRSEVLADHPAGAWQWTWDGRTNDGALTQSGIYFVHLLAGHKRAVGRVVRIAG